MRDLGRVGLRGPDVEEVGPESRPRAGPDPFALVGFVRYVAEDYAGARAAFLAAERRAPSAYHHYMLACVAAATGDVPSLVVHARAALRADRSYEQRFEEDEEFVPYRGASAFASAMGLTAAAER